MSDKQRLDPKVSAELIKVLGGTSEVGKICRVSASAVSQWKDKGLPCCRVLFLKEKFGFLEFIKSNKVLRDF